MTSSYPLQPRSKHQIWFDVFLLFMLFLTALNFVTRYFFWIYIALAVFLVTPDRKLRGNFSTLILAMLTLSILIFDVNSVSSPTNFLKPFIYLISYTIGFGLTSNCDDHSICEKEIKRVIVVSAGGLFLHYVLNMIINFGSLSRDTIDIWTNSVLSATGQASLASMCVGVVAAILFTKTKVRYKILAIVLTVIILLYNLVLAGRTLLVLLLILIAAAFLYKSIYYKKNIIKGLLIGALIVVLLVTLYNFNIFSIKDTVETSNFYWRFFENGEGDLGRDSRMDYKSLFIKTMLEHPFGGGHLREFYGNFAHDLYLDSYDEYGIFALLFIVAYMISSIIRLFRFLRHPAPAFSTKQLVFCVYLVLNIQFWLEPIMLGMPWLFAAYCLIDGALANFLINTPKSEALNVG